MKAVWPESGKLVSNKAPDSAALHPGYIIQESGIPNTRGSLASKKQPGAG
jgi:hypothetical protein